ncbi:helix-turn-helix domain-containing protein [Microbispora sp. NPDC046933]|uniref:RNA-guided endonuclease InsQ/TnpB family protein n=1 Tax=Microbispora sp. NPDC046933 TaxID=3155618 RepID=UPI0033D50B7D
MRTAYKVRIYPTAEQAAVLNRTFGCVRLVWNTVLAWRQARYRAEGATTSYSQTDRYLTELKRDGGHDFLYEVSSVPLQQALRHQHTAFVNFFAGRARHPRFKSRHGRQSAIYTRSAFRWRDGRLHLAKMDGPLEFVWSWPEVAPAMIDPTTVTVSRDPSACGHLLAQLSLSTRTWQCPSCGTRHDRDVNAAKNILAAGRAVSACGADVSPQGSSLRRSAVKQEAQPVRVGIPRL